MRDEDRWIHCHQVKHHPLLVVLEGESNQIILVELGPPILVELHVQMHVQHRAGMRLIRPAKCQVRAAAILMEQVNPLHKPI